MIFNESGTDLPSIGRKDWRSSLQAVVSLFASFFLLMAAVLLFVLWASGDSLLSADALSRGMFLSLALILLTLSLLILPSALSALASRKNHALPRWLVRLSTLTHGLNKFIMPALLIVLAAGWFVGRTPTLAGILLPILGIFAIGLPVLWFVQFGSRELEGGSLSRKWRLFGLSLTITPLLIILVEILAVLLGLIIFFAWASSKPELLESLTRLTIQLSNAASDPDEALELLIPYLVQPNVIFWVLAAACIFAPLIEEFLKVLGVWFLAGRKLTPAEGYTAGLISGAGFALVEGLFSLVSVVDNETWLFAVVGRLGGSLLHIFGSGLIGWGLATAWQQARYMKFVFVYLLSLLIHGLWNAFALAAAGLPIIFEIDATAGGSQLGLLYLPTFVLAILLLTAFMSFSVILRRQNQAAKVNL